MIEVARGKYATRADLTREATAALNSADAQQRTIAKLTAENDGLKSALTEVKRLADESKRNAAKQIEAGTSDALDAAQTIIRDLRNELGAARAHSKAIQKHWDSLTANLCAYIQGMEKISPEESFERLMNLIDGKSFLVDWDDVQKRGVSVEAIERIQRARGRRK